MTELIGRAKPKVRGVLKAEHPLARYTTWRVGGRADWYFRPADLDDLCSLLVQLPDGQPLFFLGLGSNLLIRDGGIEGAVIATQGALDTMAVLDSGVVRVEAGVPCAQVARFCARRDLTGCEFLAGIPGTMGGALAMNAGAWGGETWDWVAMVETVDCHGRIRVREPSDYEIGYRHCRLQASGACEEWFIAAHLWLRPGQGANALDRIRELLERRNAKQPVGTANCGSVFRNPENDYAARLIEASGLKGFSIGGAQVSDKHANFIINTGSATAAEIEALIAWVADCVERDHSIRLQPEVRVVGRERTEGG